ncbi:MAG: hypothetical protein CMO81_10550 [Waddliaceae bacterium]|nr:hypothetical protein [Waddliaceae bacterium]
MQRNKLLKNVISWGLALSCVCASPTIEALKFESDSGDIHGSFDNTISYGLGMRTQRQDPRIIGVGNGGTFLSLNEDDGNLNYDQWDLYSNAIKSVHELEVNKDEFGLFLRGIALYDIEIMHGDTRRTALGPIAESRMGKDLSLLDAYITYTGDTEKDKPFTLRIGNQVLNWGESTFIQNGINSMMPLDVSRLRVAGAELREAFLPVWMAFIDYGISEKISIGGFCQFSWRETRIEPKGTFFSTNDYVSPDGTYVMVSPTGDDTQSCADTLCAMGGGAGIFGQSANRGEDVSGSDRGNFGVNLRYYEPDLNETEFGLYFLQYSSRLPVVSGYKGNAIPILGPGAYIPDSYYFVEYPDDIHLLGLSFNTMLGKIALQGEYSLKIDQPLQISGYEIILAVLGSASPVSQLGAFPDASEITGFRRKTVSQMQFTATKMFGPCGVMSSSAILAEVGAMYIHGFPDQSTLRFDGPGTIGSGGQGYATRFSGGYNLVLLGTFDKVNAQTYIAFAHDVSGRSPLPLSNFVKNRKSITLSGEIRRHALSWKATFSHFFSGGTHNLLRDRDHITLSSTVSF